MSNKNALNVVEGCDGILRDKDNRPMILVFDTRPKGRKHYSKPKKAEGTTESEVESLIWVGNTSQSKAQRESTKRNIRSHVMKNFKRHQKPLLFEIQEQAVKSSAQAINLASVEATSFPFCQRPSRTLDPFTQYPIQMQPRTYELFHRYTSVIMHVSYPNELTRDSAAGASLFELAMNDTASFHMLLCSSAMYSDVISGNNESAEANYHKLQAIHEINRRLRSGADASDATIAAVSSLAKVELILGNHDLWIVHTNGLIQMVNLRGGLHKVNRRLQQRICMADILGNSISDSPPLFPLFKDQASVSSFRPSTLKLEKGFQSIVELFHLDFQIVEILKDVQFLSTQVLQARSQHSTLIVTIDGIATELRHRLLSCAKSKTSTQAEITRECCRLGTLIYLKSLLQSYPQRSGAYQILLQKLRASIERLDAFRMCDEVAELVIWLLFICGMAKRREPEEGWFVDRLLDVTEVLKIVTMDGVKAVLMKFLWVHDTHEGIVSALWNEAVARKILKA